MFLTSLLALFLSCSTPHRTEPIQNPAESSGVTSPESHLGRPVGADFHLVDWKEVSSYFEKLTGESDSVMLETVGTTTEGRDFLLATISSPENLARLEELREHAKTLADPRGKSAEEIDTAVRDGKVFVFVSCSMHATECAGSQFAMEFAHTLATSMEEPWASAREECVVLLAPSLNPDGVDHVTEWYRETVGTPYEASGLLKLYQYYAGHDNNRDWFMLTQNETRIVTELLYKRWFPQVYWDVHQQGSSRERFFVPPFRDPLNPNLDSSIIGGIDVLGSRALLDLTRAGLSGVSTGVSYDMWWNGGNRNVPVRHNIIGLLTEAASARLATPIFLPRSKLSAPSGLGSYAPSNRFPEPWPGGWWRLRDIIDYEMGFGESLLASLSRERSFWLRNASDVAKRAVEVKGVDAPRAWVIPSDNRDPGAVRRLVDVLLRGGVELAVSKGEVNADGRTWPAGSIVIRRDQPYGSHVKDLLEVQKYPIGDPPYDVAGWTLPFLLGVARVEVMDLSEFGEMRFVAEVESATAAFAGDTRTERIAGSISTHDSRSWTSIYAGLAEGKAFGLETEGEGMGLVMDPESDAFSGKVIIDTARRVGLYSPWSGSKDEGWMRYVFDTQEVPYVTVRNEMLRAGQLDKFLDVLVIPSISGRQLDSGRAPGSIPAEYAGGLDAEGAVAIEEFVRGGGTLITLGSSSSWALDLFELPLVDVTSGGEAKDFSCPGSVLRTIPQANSYTAGLPASLPVFFSRSSAFREMTAEEMKGSSRTAPTSTELKADEDENGEALADFSDAEPLTQQFLLRYAPSRLLMSGWIQSPEVIEGHAAWVVAPHGKGRVHIFGFRPQYRGWTQATFGLVHRAILLE
ncbi:MAG: hypothetical protein ACI9X4_000345 [Glaciecola sp.]|jgi:hypothetical protein